MTLHSEAAAGDLTRRTLLYYLKECSINETNPKEGKTHGLTPLALAAQNGHVETVRLLLANGANVDALSSKCQTPLWIVTAQGQGRNRAEVVELLLKYKANARYSHPNLRGGSKPLENELVQRKDPEVIQLLVEEKGTTAEAEKLASKLHNPEIDDAMKSTRQRRKRRDATVNLISAFIVFVITAINSPAITRMIDKILAKSSINEKNIKAINHQAASEETDASRGMALLLE